MSTRDTTCASCGEFTSKIYPVDALENVENPDCIDRNLGEYCNSE